MTIMDVLLRRDLVKPPPPIPELLPRPEPALNRDEGPSQEYRDLIKELALPAPYLERIDMIKFCDDHELKVYSNAAVEAYMHRLAERITLIRRRAKNFDRVYFSWTPLVHYTRPIPLRVLKNVKTIRDFYPQAEFYITHIAVHPDPFIAWVPASHIGQSHRTFEYVIFDCWDEPGYEEARPDPSAGNSTPYDDYD